MTYAEYFTSFKGRFMGADVSDIQEHLAFQFNIEDDEAGGIFTPQNKELVSTSDLVKEIAKVNRHKVFFTGVFNFIIPWGIKWNKNMQRAFINDYYDLPISNDYNFEYCIVDFRESIKRTEE